MDAYILVRAADRPDDLRMLREFAAERDAQALERHLSAPRYHPALTRVGLRAGAIAGYALISHRRLRLGAATLDSGALSIVAGGDADRSELFTALLGDCLGTLLDQGLPIATLVGTHAAYAPFGFAPYCFDAAAELRGAVAHPSAALRPPSQNDLDDLAALYAASYAGLALAEDRAPADWRAWLGQRDAMLLEDGRGRLVAYAALGLDQPAEALAIGEAAAADAGAARELCAALLARAGGKLVLGLSPWHPLTSAALHLGGMVYLRAPAESAQIALAGIVDLPGVLEALAPEFERRLGRSRYAGWKGNLRIEIETERVTLAFEDGRALVIDGSRPADLRLRQVQLPALAQLCLGYRAAADLRATGGLACDDAALGLIDVLFPTVFAAS